MLSHTVLSTAASILSVAASSEGGALLLGPVKTCCSNSRTAGKNVVVIRPVAVGH